MTGIASRARARDELRDFLLSGEPVPAAMEVRAGELPRAVGAYLRTSRAFRREGLLRAVDRLPHVAAGLRSDQAETAGAAFAARSAAWRVLGVVRTLAGRHRCLEESLGVAAALRALGFPAEVVIGYPVIEPAAGDDELHAWPELAGGVVTERLGSAPLNYVEVVRFPDRRPPREVIFP